MEDTKSAETENRTVLENPSMRLKADLLKNARRLKACAEVLLFATEKVIEAKEALSAREAELMTMENSPIKGSNEKARDYSLKQNTKAEREALHGAEKEQRALKLDYENCIEERQLLENLIKLQEIEVAELKVFCP